MNKTATIAVALIVCSGMALSQAKPGGFAREAAMGGGQVGTNMVINPFIFDDPSYMYLNPAYQQDYKNYMWANIGGGFVSGLTGGNNGYGNQNAGVNIGFGPLALGVILSHDPSAVNTVSTLIGGIPGFGGTSIARRGLQTIPGVANVFEVMASVDLGPLDVGGAIMYGRSNFDSTASFSSPNPTFSNEREASSSVLGIRGGLTLDMGGGNALEASATFRLDNATDNIKDSVSRGEYSASGTELGVIGRLRLKMSNRVNLIPYAAFGLLSAEPKEDTPPQGLQAITRTVKVTALGIAAGVGAEYKTPQAFVAGGVSFQTVSVKGEVSDTGAIGTTSLKTSLTGVPVINLGGEWWFLDWLAGRFGYYRAIASTNNTFEGRGFTWEGSRTTPISVINLGGLNGGTNDALVTLGLGFRFGNFSMDATVSEEALRRGLGLIGAQDNINTFGYINASYAL